MTICWTDPYLTLGHAHLDTTMRYLTPSLPGVRNPLDQA